MMMNPTTDKSRKNRSKSESLEEQLHSKKNSRDLPSRDMIGLPPPMNPPSMNPLPMSPPPNPMNSSSSHVGKIHLKPTPGRSNPPAVITTKGGMYNRDIKRRVIPGDQMSMMSGKAMSRMSYVPPGCTSNSGMDLMNFWTSPPDETQSIVSIGSIMRLYM
jgi:hypothetical protein